jgi:Xaa-Pro aminopeptidase
MTRSFQLTDNDSNSKTNLKMNEIYKIVREAQRIGIEAIKPGVSTGEIDKLCRDYIIEKGYGEYFNHGTGHGIGLEIHEMPYLNPIKDSIKLEVGMVITVEPGIYISGLGGVRIEDDVLVTPSGYEILTTAPHFDIEKG